MVKFHALICHINSIFALKIHAESAVLLCTTNLKSAALWKRNLEGTSVPPHIGANRCGSARFLPVWRFGGLPGLSLAIQNWPAVPRTPTINTLRLRVLQSRDSPMKRGEKIISSLDALPDDDAFMEPSRNSLQRLLFAAMTHTVPCWTRDLEIS